MNINLFQTSLGKKMAWTLLLGLALYLGALAFLTVVQRHFMYFGGLTAAQSLTEAKAPREMRELRTVTEDNQPVRIWFAPATKKRHVLVFFHGNADSIGGMAYIARPYLDAGYGFALVEYRGFGGQPGKPTEQGLYADARAAIKALRTSGVPPETMVLMGHSLGTGVAVQMATEFPKAGLVLLAPFLSMGKMAQIRYPIFPAERLTMDKYESAKKIADIHAPLLILHGTADLVIPQSQGQTLANLAREPKTFESLPGKGHADLFDEAAPKILSWLDALDPPKPLPTSA